MKRFSGYPKVEVRPLPAGDNAYVLIETLAYRTDIIEQKNIIVHKGFVSDGASVPRIFWPLFPPMGNYTAAAIVHDYICVEKICSSKDGAKIFLEAMKDLGVPKPVRYPMYLAVRVFGPRF